MKRCAIYTRKSTSQGLDQAFNSLDAQREACAKYISGQDGWQQIAESYDDGGFTGANTERPAFKRLLADIGARKIDVVVVYKVDRLSRSLLDFAQLMQAFSSGGCSFVSVTQNFSTADAMGRLTLNMLMSFAEFEREMIAERTRDKIRAARAKGKWTGGVVPFGYRVQDMRLVVEPREALVARRLFETFIETRSLNETARRLNREGLLPRARKSRLNDGWNKDSVVRVLRSPYYLGKVQCGSELVDGEHPVVVDLDTVEEAREVLREDRFGAPPPKSSLPFPLRGRLRCGQCGSAMVPAVTRKDGRAYRYYRCCARDRHGPECCPGKPLPAGAVEQWAADQARVQIERLADVVELVVVHEARGEAEVTLRDGAA